MGPGFCAQLTSLAKLTSLELGGQPVDDAGLEALAQHLVGLQHLSIWGSQVSDAAVAILADLQRLSSLDLSWTPVQVLPAYPNIQASQAAPVSWGVVVPVGHGRAVAIVAGGGVAWRNAIIRSCLDHQVLPAAWAPAGESSPCVSPPAAGDADGALRRQGRLAQRRSATWAAAGPGPGPRPHRGSGSAGRGHQVGWGRRGC
jgi:hypothetical protein